MTGSSRTTATCSRRCTASTTATATSRARPWRSSPSSCRLTAAHVYGATTYYADFRTTPPPPVTLAWCSGPACRLRNASGIRAAFEAVFGCALGEDSPDGRVAFTLGQCNGTCEQAPQVWLQERVVGKLNAARAVEIARALRDGTDPDTLGWPDDGADGNALDGTGG